QHVRESYFVDGGNATKAGIIDYLFKNRTSCLLLDEIDKMSPRDQTFLLNLMETGVITETKYGKTRQAEIKTSVFATNNDPREQDESFVLPILH
ncbi:MAG: AAA family ATPase, partial [Candidatus Nitrosopolaris sp.]